MEKQITKKIQTVDIHFNRLIGEDQSDVLTSGLESITSLGSVAINTVIVLFLFLIGQKSVGTQLGIGLIATWIIVFFLKELIDRKRPETDSTHVFSNGSFPSGHSATAFLTATILSFFTNLQIFLYFLAGLIAFSRLYLENHYLSDVLVGALIGLSVGAALLI